MNYSNLIVSAAQSVSAKLNCSVETAAEYIENVVFNSECDLHSFFRNNVQEVK